MGVGQKRMAIFMVLILFVDTLALITPKKVKIGNCFRNRNRPECPPPATTEIPTTPSPTTQVITTTAPSIDRDVLSTVYTSAASPATQVITTTAPSIDGDVLSPVYTSAASPTTQVTTTTTTTAPSVNRKVLSTVYTSAVDIGIKIGEVINYHYASTEKRNITPEADLSIMKKYSGTVSYISTDTTRLTIDHVEIFNEVYENISIISQQLESGTVFIAEIQINYLKSYFILNAQFIVQLREEVIYTTQIETLLQRKTTIEEFHSYVKGIYTNLQSLTQSLNPSSTSTVSTGVLVSANQLFTQIQVEGYISITSSLTFTSFQSEIESFIESATTEGATFTNTDITLIVTVTEQISKVISIAAIEIQSIQENQANLHKKLNLNNVLAAISVVEESLNIFLENVDPSSQTTITIPDNILDSFISIEGPVEYGELASLQEINNIKAIEAFTVEVSGTSYSSVTNLDRIIMIKEEIKYLALESQEILKSKTSLGEYYEILVRASSSLTTLINGVKSLLNESPLDSAESSSNITTITSSLSALVISELTFESVLYIERATYTIIKTEMGSILTKELVSLKTEAEAKLDTIQDKISKNEKANEILQSIFQVETLIQIVKEITSVVGIIKNTVSVSSSSIAVNNTYNLESHIELLITQVTLFSSLSYTATDLDIYNLQQNIDQFSDLVNNIQEISRLREVNQLESTVNNVKLSLSNYQNVLHNSFTIKSQISAYYDLSDYLLIFKNVIQELNESESSEETTSAFIINLIKSELTVIKEYFQFTTESNIELLRGFLKTLDTITGKINNKTSLISFIDGIHTELLQTIDVKLEEDTEEQKTLRENEMFILISESHVSLQMLVELTSESGETGTSQELESVKNIYDKLISNSRYLNASLETINELKEIIFSLTNLVKNITDGEIVVEKIDYLQESLVLAAELIQTFKIKFEQKVTSKLEIVEDLQNIISSTLKSLEGSVTALNSNLEDTSDADLVNSIHVDTLYNAIKYLDENINSINQKYVLKFEAISQQVRKLITINNGIKIISGYTVTTQETITLIKEVLNTLADKLIEEKNYEELVKENQLALELQGAIELILALIENIKEFNETSSQSSPIYTQQFEDFVRVVAAITSETFSLSEYVLLQFAEFNNILYDILDSNQKPNGIDLEVILNDVNKALEVSNVLKLLAEENQFILDSIRVEKIIVDFSKNILSVIEGLVDNLEIDQLTGDIFDPQAIKLIGEFLELTDRGYDSQELFNSLKKGANSVLSYLQSSPSAFAYIFEFKRIVTQFKEQAEERIERWIDRDNIKKDLNGISVNKPILELIYEAISEKISSLSTTSAKQTTSAEITEYINTIQIIKENTINFLTKDELEIILSNIQNLVAEPKYFKQLMQLQALTEESFYETEIEENFLSLTVESGIAFDITYASKPLLQTTEDFLYELISGVRGIGSNDAEEKETPQVYEEFKESLLKFDRIEHLSYNFLIEFKLLGKAVKSVDIHTVDEQIIKHLLKHINSAQYEIEKTISISQSIFIDRSTDVGIKTTQSVANKTIVLLEELQSVSDDTGTQIVDTAVNKLLVFLEDIYKTAIFTDVKTILLLESFVDDINSEDYANAKIDGLTLALGNINYIKNYADQEYTKSGNYLANTVTVSIKDNFITILEDIDSLIIDFTNSIGLITQEIENKDIFEVYSYFSSIETDSLTIAHIDEATQWKIILESINVDDGIGIKYLTDLKVVIKSLREEIKSDKTIFTIIKKNRVSQDIYKKTEKSLTTIRSIIEKFKVVVVTEENESTELFINSLLETLDSVDFQSESTNTINSLYERSEVFIGILSVVRESLTITEETKIMLISKITTLIKVIQVKITKHQSHIIKLEQSKSFSDVISVLEIYSNITSEVLEVVDESTEITDSRTKKLLKSIIRNIKAIYKNPINVKDKILEFIKQKIQEFNYIKSNQLYSKHLSEINKLATKTLSAVTIENTILKSETTKEANAAKIHKQRQTLEYTNNVLAQFTLTEIEITDETRTVKVESIYEIREIISIIVLIQQGTATATDIANLQFYTEYLQQYIEFYGQSVRFIDFEYIIQDVSKTITSLEYSYIETHFTLSQSESIYQAKKIKVLFSSIIEKITMIVNVDESKTGEIYSGSVFEDIQNIIISFESKLYVSLISILENILTELTTITDNLDVYAKIQNLSGISLKLTSILVSVSKSISEHNTIVSISEEISIKEKAIYLYSLFENTLTKIEEKSLQSSSESFTSIYGIQEIIEFIQNQNIQSIEYIFILREYYERFVLIEETITEEKYNITELLSFVTHSKIVENYAYNENKYIRDTKLQITYTYEASKSAEKARQQFSEIQESYSLEQIEETFEVTNLYNSLNSLDFSSITAVSLYKINKEIQAVLQIVSTSSKSIVFLNSIQELFLTLERNGKKHVQRQQSYLDEQIFYDELTKSKVIFSSAISHLESLSINIDINGTFTENTIITDLYQILLSIKYDFRSFNKEVSEQLHELIEELIGTAVQNSNIKYLSETIILFKQLIVKGEQYSLYIKQSENIIVINEFLSVVSQFEKTVINLIYYHSGNEESGIQSTQDTFTSEITGVTYTYLEIVNIVTIHLQHLSTESVTSYDSVTFVEIKEFITILINKDINFLISQIGEIEVKKLLILTQQVNVKLTRLIKITESEKEAQQFYDDLHEASNLLIHIQEIYLEAQMVGQISSYRLSLLKSILQILQNIDSVYSFNQQIIASVTSYLLELKATRSDSGSLVDITNNIIITQISSVIPFKIRVIKETLYSQESFIFSTASYELDEVFYSKDELTMINYIKTTSQQSYISTEIHLVFDILYKTLNLFSNFTEADSTEENQSEEQGGITVELFELKTLLQIVRRNEFEISIIRTVFILIEKLKYRYDAKETIKTELKKYYLNYISETQTWLYDVNTQQSAYIKESRTFLNIKAANSLVESINFSKLLDSENIFSTDEISEDKKTELSYHIEYTIQRLLKFKLDTSNISQEFLYSFRENVNYIATFEFSSELYELHLGSIKFIKNFLVSGGTESNERGALDRSYIQSEYLLKSDAQKILITYKKDFSKLSQGLTGTTEFESPSQARLQQILTEISRIFILWSKRGIVVREQIVTLKTYYSEITELSILLQGYKKIEAIDQVLILIKESEEHIFASLKVIDEEISYSYEFAKIEKRVYLYSSTLTIFESVQNNEITLETNNDAFLATIESEISVYSYILETALLDPFGSSIYDINLFDFILSFQNISSINSISGFNKFIIVLRDVSEHALAIKQAKLFEKASLEADKILNIIALDITTQYHEAEDLQQNKEISRINSEFKYISQQLHSITSKEIRIIIQNKFNLQKVKDKYGVNILYFNEVVENLMYIKTASSQYQILEVKGFEARRTHEILSGGSTYLKELGNYLLNYIDFSGKSQNNYIKNEETFYAFYSLFNYTLNFISLPRELGKIVKSYDLEQFVTGNKYQVAYIEEIYFQIKRYENILSSSKIVSKTTNDIKILTKVKNILVCIIDKVKYSLVNSDDFSVDSSKTTYLFEGKNVTIKDIFGDIEYILNESKLKQYDFTNTILIKLENYKKIISSISLIKGVNENDLISFAQYISNTVVHLTNSLSIYKSTIHNIYSYNLISYIHDINGVIELVLNGSTSVVGSTKIKYIVESLVEYYQLFANGFSFIRQESVIKSLKLAYELKYSKFEGNEQIDSSELLNLVSNVNSIVNEYQGFLSVHIFNYHKYVKKSSFKSEDVQLSVSSQNSFIFYHVITLLTQVNDKLSGIIPQLSDNIIEGDAIYNNKIKGLYLSVAGLEQNYYFLEFEILYQLSEFIILIDDNFGDYVNQSTLIDLQHFINLKLEYFIITFDKISYYGKISTQALILDKAIGDVDLITREVKFWIYGEESCSEYDEYDTTAIDTSTIDKPDAEADPDESQLLQNSFDIVSKNIIHWSLDRSTVSLETLNTFDLFLKQISYICSFVNGLHIWEHNFIDSDIPFGYLLKTIYKPLENERIEIYQKIIIYENYKLTLSFYIPIIEFSNSIDGDSYDKGNLSSYSNFSKPVDGDDNESYELDDGFYNVDKEVDSVIKHVYHITQKWKKSTDLSIAGTLEFKGYVLELWGYLDELSDLIRAGGKIQEEEKQKLITLFEEINGNLEVLLDNELEKYSSHEIISANEFQQNVRNQTKSLIYYSFKLINAIIEENDVDNVSSDENSINDLQGAAEGLFTIVQAYDFCNDETTYEIDSAVNATGTGYFSSYFYETSEFADLRNATYSLYQALKAIKVYEQDKFADTLLYLEQASQGLDCV